MKATKKVIAQLEKCYALSPLTTDGQPRLLAATEKRGPGCVYALDGTRLSQVWDEPGGIMTMVPVPGKEACFLATHEFFSPNDAASARLVCARLEGSGWQVTTVAPLPWVHRFDILPRDGVNYALACTLKSGQEYKDDWRFGGKLLTGVLSDDPARPLELTVFKDGLGHNHGYTRYYDDRGRSWGLVCCDEGVFQAAPPEAPGGDWTWNQLLDEPCSDGVYLDLDLDGQPELLTLSPFHGDTIAIWHQDPEGWRQVYRYPEKLPFLHAICGGPVYGRPTVYVGHREGERLFLGFFYDPAAKEYRFEVVDRGAGPANCMLFARDGHPALLATNRETDELAIYDIFED